MFRLAVRITQIALSVVLGGGGGEGVVGGLSAPWAGAGNRSLLCGFEHHEMLGDTCNKELNKTPKSSKQV